jgi:hypothetical protein
MLMTALTSSGATKWTFTNHDGYWDFKSVALGSDGTAYIGSSHDIQAVNSDGSLKWIKASDTPYALGIASDGTVYAGCGGFPSSFSSIVAVNPAGTDKWTFKMDDVSTSAFFAISSEGTIYLGAHNNLYAVASNGKLKWKFGTSGDVSSPAIASDGTIYVGSGDGYLYAIGGTSHPAPPTAPQDLSTSYGSSGVQLSWASCNPGTYSLAGYTIFRGTSSNVDSFAPVSTVSVDARSYVDANVVPGGTYYYYVKGFDNAPTTVNYSAPSNVASIKIPKKTVIVLNIGKSAFTVNGVSSTLDSPPVIKNGRTLLPIKPVIDALGGAINWNSSERKVTITLKDTTIALWIGKNTAIVNGSAMPIDSQNLQVVPEIISGRTMLPLRFVTAILGATLGWDPNTQTITITYQP